MIRVVFHQPRSQALSSLPPLVTGLRLITLATNFSTVESQRINFVDLN